MHDEVDIAACAIISLLRRTLLSALIFLAATPVLNATDCVATGVITDPSGAPVPEATVSFYRAGPVLLASRQSDTTGTFAIGPVLCGEYLVAAVHPGFAEYRGAVRLRAAESTRIAIVLSLVPVEEHVTVTAEAGGIERALDIDQRTATISRTALNERTKTVVTEAAQNEAGVHEVRTAPGVGSFSVRGLTGKNVAVYRDGFRYSTSAQRGGISTFQNLIDPAALDSIEVIRGSNSAQYGSDSIGGTVNLLSAFPLQTNRRVTGEVAPSADYATASFGGYTLLGVNGRSFNSVTVLFARRVNTTRAAQGLDTHAAVTRFLGLPADILGDRRLPDTAFTRYGGSHHMQRRFGQQRQLVFHYERAQQDGAKRYDQLLGGDGNLIADLRNLMLDFGYVRYQSYGAAGLDHFSTGVSYNAQREDRVNQGGQGNPLASISHQYERLAAWGMNFIAQKRVTSHDLALGGEGYFERLAAPSFTYSPATTVLQNVRGRVPDGARYLTHGLFVQDIWRPAPFLRVSGSVRFGGASYRSGKTQPTDSLSANALTGRIGASARLSSAASVHARYARGFRVPSITDLGTLGLQGNGAFEANPNDVLRRGATIGDRADDRAQPTGRPVERLRPEITNNYEAGATLQHRTVRAELSGFWTDLRNTIVSQTLLLPPGAAGQMLGDQIISRQLPSGAVFVPLSAGPVLVRANYYGARLRGIEHALRIPLARTLTYNHNVTWIHAADERTGLPPDIEPGIPPLTFNASVLYSRRRLWIEPYATFADRQARLSSLALADRRIGAARSRANIANFFNNGARVRGLVENGRLVPTGETLAEVQTRVLGVQNSAPLLTAIPGYGLVGLRAGIPAGESGDLFVDLSNMLDKTYRGIGWGVPGAGRSVSVRYRLRF